MLSSLPKLYVGRCC